MHFLRDSGVSAVLEHLDGTLFSCLPYTLRFSARRFLALTKKSLFIEAPLIKCIYGTKNAHFIEVFMNIEFTAGVRMYC